MFDFEEAKEFLSYDPDTGLFTWVKHSGSAYPGKPANAIDNEGYVRINFKKTYAKGHTLAWYLVHGVKVSGLDHINGIKHDNRICNLRIATNAENQRNKRIQKNNRSGAKGVTHNEKSNMYIAHISVDGKVKYLGSFRDIEDAKSAYAEASKRYHGEFSNTG
ncbi:hypothetical protein FJ875_05635 [Salmonella enterica]|nr:hypothetical protein [Salmonella enterica]EDW4366582.1 hypothetical protein [Salmonella enterica subsp. diarizonae]EDX5033557.1 hypothetical protein [Salmonella enterica subsp. enterica serovar Saintpaul]EAW6214921.1 hypothetical protein [Salmonella enterica]EAX6174045.1 hypothetical protein [Salmonella enterica]